MPDLEISNLPALAEAGVAATDPLAIADISASETKKVTVKDLIEAGVALIDNTSIPGAKIGTLSTDQVATGAIQDDAVTNAKIEYPSISLGGLTLVLGSTDATPALNLTDATNYPTSSLTGTITNAQLAGSIANSKLTNSSVSFGGISLALGGTDATPAFNLQDATGYKTTSLVGTITNAQLAGSIANSKLVASSVSLGGVSVALGGTDATPAFNLTDATNYPTSALVGTVTNAQLAGSIANAKLANSSVSLGGVSVALGGTDATPAFDLADATGYLTSSLVGTITNAQLAGSIDVSKLSSSTNISLGGVSIALGSTDATPAFNLSDATHYPTSALVGTITNAQLAGSIANSKLTNSSVSLGGITVALGASDATPAFDLTDATGYKTTNLVGTITNAQLAGSIDLSKLVSSSASIGGVAITLGTTDATPAFDLQDATGYPTSALVGTITNAQLAGSIAATKLVSGSITSTQLDSNSVTDTELANNAVDTGAVQNGAITNDKVETSTSAITGLDGATKLRDGTVTPAKLNTSNLDRSLNVASGNLGINNAVTGGAATRSGVSYNAEGLITGTAALVAGDLPVSTATAVGGVSIPTAGGLTITGTGAVSIAATTTAATATKVTYNTFGQIISSAALAGTDLPVGTANTVGALSVPTGGPLSVDSNGALTVSNSGVSAGTGTKVTVDAKGRVTTLANLSDSDLPNHSAALLTSGSIAAARLSNDSIDGSKLSDSSTTIFQSIAQQGYPTAQFNGQLLFDTVSEDAFIWDGTAWQAITTLTKGSLVFGGTFNANTSQMVSTTSAGIAAGLSVGSNLPTPSETVDGVYVVVSTSGTPTSPAPVVALAPPDYILGVTNTSGSSWNEVDLSQTVAGQVASNITFTPYGQLSATNVQDALQELETEKMSFAGGTITGQVLIGNTGSLVFEGSTVDDYEITLAVADPTTSDKTITLPDVTGTVITSGDTGTVTSTMIVDGTIVNADINASAAIALTKLQGIASAKIIVGDSSGVATEVAVTGDIAITNTGVTSITSGSIVNADISGSAAITGSKVTTGTTSAVGVLQLTDGTTSTSTTTAATPAGVKAAKDAADAAQTTADAALPKAGGTLTDNLIIDNGKELRLSEADGDGSNYTGLKAQAQSGDITLTLPAVAPTANQVLKADASTPTTLTWATDAATDATKMPLAGGTFTGDVTFTGDASNGLWDKSASKFVANLTGNADTATALAANVNIGGVAFDGTASINLPGVNAAGNQSTTGNAATATKFASSVNIGGVAFDGSASINLPGVNAAGNQDTSGTAALATEFTVTANNSTDETVYLLFVDGATGSQGAETDTGLTYNPSTGLLTSTGFSGSGASLTSLNADEISSGTVAAARLGSGSSVTTKFLRGDNTWQTISATPEGTAILSTGESGGTKFLREDGDGTCSWQSVPAGVTINNQADNRIVTATGTTNTLNGEASLTFDGTNLDLPVDKKIRLGNSQELEIYVNSSSNAVIKDNGSGALMLAGSYVSITSSNLNSQAAFFDAAAACQLNYAASKKIETTSSGVAVTGALTVSGDLTVNGTTTTVNSTTVEVADKNIELGKVASPSDTTADGGGLTLKGATDKTFNWVNSTDAWTSSEHIEVASGKTFIGNVTGNVSGTSGGFTAGSASNLNAGTVSIDRLGSSGTASSSTFLRGDGAWAAAAAPAGSNGEIQYYYNGALASQSGFTIDNSTGDVYIAGASAGLSWDKSANELNLASGAKAKFGSGSNYFYIHYNPSATRPELYINNSNEFAITASGGDIAEIHQTGEVILKGDFLLRDGTNTKIEWDKSADSLIFDAQTKLKLGNNGEIYQDGSGDLRIDTGSNTEFNVSGTQRLKVNSQGATITGTCTATVGFSGSAANLTNVNAESVDVTLSSTNANHFPLFASSNGSGQAGNTANAQDVLADGNLFYNPSTNVLTAGSFSGVGTSLTALSASSLQGSLPAISGASLTSLPAANLTGNLPAVSGANLTNLNASNINQGQISSSLIPTLNQDTSGNAEKNTVLSTGNNQTFKLLFTDSSGTDKYNFVENQSGQAEYNPGTNTLTIGNYIGDGSQLTNLPASGGTVDLYTSSSGSGVTAGQPVYVDANGKAVAVAGSATAKQPLNKYVNEAGNWVFHNPPSSTSGAAPGSGISGNNISYGYSQAICTISGVTYIVIVYADQTNSTYSYYRVGKFDTTNTRTITWGTATAFYSASSPSPQVVNMGNTGRFVLCAHQSGSWNTIYFWAATINTSGLSLTFNSSQQNLFSSYSEYIGGNYSHGRFCQKNDSFCFFSFSNQASWVRATQIQWSGLTSYFTAVDPHNMLAYSWTYSGSGMTPAISFSNVGGSSGIVAIVGADGSASSNSGQFKAVAAAAPPDNQTWTSVNYGSDNSIYGRPWGGEQVIGWISSTKFYVAYVENKQSWEREDEAHIVIANTNSNYGISSIAQNTITTGSEKAGYNTLWAGWDSGSSRLVISYTQKQNAIGTTTWYPYTNTATLSGSTGISLGTATKLAMPTGDGSSVFTVKTTYGEDSFFQIVLPKEVTPHPADNTSFIQIAGVCGGSTSDRGWIQFLEHKDNSHDGASFIGFAQSSISAGAEGTINVTGSTNDQVSGLTAGSIYYIGVGGNLSTLAVSPTTRVGIALSATKILVGA